MLDSAVGIELDGVTKVYSPDSAIYLDRVRFNKGESYCILGPSGCGKSTLLNLIAGNIKPTEGDIYIDNRELARLSQRALNDYRFNKVGYISQDFRLFEEFSVKDNLKIVGQGGKLTNSPKRVIDMVGLSHKYHSRVKNLSGGEKQRVSIARALLKSPDIMLCDEPTASLNYKLALDIIKLLIDTHKELGNTLIVVTHDDRLTEFFDSTIKFEYLLQKDEVK